MAGVMMTPPPNPVNAPRKPAAAEISPPRAVSSSTFKRPPSCTKIHATGVFSSPTLVLMLDLRLGDRLAEPPALLLQVKIWEMVGRGGPLTLGVLAILLIFSIFSWAIIFSKWSALRTARSADARFLRAFRKA